ncbi:hypothetical protein CR513_02817, partial [Mucuna pruriens]
MLDLGASINVMPTSIYKSLSFGDLSVVQPLGILEDVLVQVNELIFPTDFYVLDMEDETSGKGSTLILGRPFLMTARTKIDVHAGTVSIEFGEAVSVFNKIAVVKADPHVHVHAETISTKEDQKQARAESILANHGKNHVPSRSDLSAKQRVESDYNPTKFDSIPAKKSRPQQPKAKIMSTHLVPSPIQVGQPNLKGSNDNPSSLPPPMELKPLPSHLKYAYLDSEQQFPVIVASNLCWEQEDKLLSVLRQHKKAIGWKLFDISGISYSICMHRILMEEEAKPIRK